MALYMTTREASDKLGMSPDWVRNNLDYARDNRNNILKEGRQHVVYTEDVKLWQKRLDEERKLNEKRILHAEDLSSKNRNKLTEAAFEYQTLSETGREIDGTRKEYGEIIKRYMKGKTTYTGDGDIIKSISRSPRKTYEVDKNKISKLFSEDELIKSGIGSIEVDAQVLLLKGKLHVKEKIHEICNDFREYCSLEIGKDFYSINLKDLRHALKGFLAARMKNRPWRGTRRGKPVQKHEFNIDLKYLLPIIKDFQKKRLGEKKSGMYAREIAENCINEIVQPGALRVILNERAQKILKENLDSTLEDIDLNERLDAITKKLPVE